jgi:hypothetical protein
MEKKEMMIRKKSGVLGKRERDLKKEGERYTSKIRSWSEK